jgi:hypothetical protein
MLRATSLTLFLTVLLVLAAGCDADSAEVTAKIVAEVDEKKATFSHPLKCDAWVVHSGTPGEMPRTRCYVRPELTNIQGKQP